MAQSFLFTVRLSQCAEISLLRTRMSVARAPPRDLEAFQLQTSYEVVQPKVQPGAPVQRRICLRAENVTCVC